MSVTQFRNLTPEDVVNDYIKFQQNYYPAVNNQNPKPFNVEVSVDGDLNIGVISRAIRFTSTYDNSEQIVTVTEYYTEPATLDKYTVDYTSKDQTALSTSVIQYTYNAAQNADLLYTFKWIDGKSVFNNGKKYYDNNDVYYLRITIDPLRIKLYFQRDLSKVLDTITPAIFIKNGITVNVKSNLTFNNNLKKMLMHYDNYNDSNCIYNNIISDMVEVPIIDIEGQTTYNAEYLSDFTFIIQDKYKYYVYDPELLKGKCHCEPIYIDSRKLKKTTFLVYGPELQCVVKGKDKTLRGKLYNYYINHPTDFGPSFDEDFYGPMIFYSMTKYILARLIYGDFNINYLCRNFNKQFFKDLKHTRFCGFIEVFTNPIYGIVGYDKYFIKCNKECSDKC
jgi:hypothetical protein